jgi:hypothetical protein
MALASPLAAQAPAVRLIAAPDTRSSQRFASVAAVRALPDGQLLVNDVGKRQLTLLTQALQNPTIVADSAAGQATSYGTAAGGIIPYIADSTLFVDPELFRCSCSPPLAGSRASARSPVRRMLA